MNISKTSSVLYACIAGSCLFAIAMGVNRFSYAPIIPFLVNNHWLNNPQAGYVGSANFLGYFLGAYAAHKLTHFVSIHKIMLGVLVISVLASVLCVFNFGYIWLGLWRLVVGFVAGVIMVLTPTVILSNVTDQQKGLISGIMFAGIGIGIAVISLLVPLFSAWGGVVGIWVGLVLMTVTSWVKRRQRGCRPWTKVEVIEPRK